MFISFFRLCAHCGLTFTNRTIFNKHLKRHEIGVAIECDICSKPFYTLQEVHQHKSKEHAVEKKKKKRTDYLCDFCGKHFTRQSTFYSHKKIHIVQGEFKCSQCDKVFNQKIKLRKHIKSHSTERRYMCEMCGYQSKYPDSLRKHRRRHISAPVKVCIFMKTSSVCHRKHFKLYAKY